MIFQAVGSKLEQVLKKGEMTEANQRVLDAQKAVEDAEAEAQKKVNELRGEVDSLTKHYNKKVCAHKSFSNRLCYRENDIKLSSFYS